MPNKKIKSVFEDFSEPKPETKNLFARIPKDLREDFDFVVREVEGKSIYDGVEVACRLLIQRFREENPDVRLPSDKSTKN